jgi:pimeloyl-ACP methyl ester carboxylesterase
MEEHDVAVNGTTIHYADWAGEGRPIVCVHGLTANCRYFDSLGEKLAPGYRVVAYDLRGCGNSGKPTTGRNIVRHAADLEELLDVLSLERPVVLGHSLGASISGFFAAHFPARVHELILVDGGGGGPLADYDTVFKNIRPMVARLGVKYASVDEYLGLMRSAYGDAWTTYAERVYSYDAGMNPDGSVSAKMSVETATQNFYALKNYDALNAFSRIQCKTLLLRATEGYLGGPPILPRQAAEYMARAIAGCTLVDVNGTDHATILLGGGDATSEAIRSFLKE